MKKNIKEFFDNIKKIFTKEEPKGDKDSVTGNTFKEKFSNINSRIRNAGSPVRVAFFTTYETARNILFFMKI